MVQIEIPAAKDGGTVVLKAGKAKPSENPQIKGNPEETGNSESQDSDSQDSDSSTTTGKPANEAEYTSLDGITVTGWDKVIDLAFADAKTQMASVEIYHRRSRWL